MSYLEKLKKRGLPNLVQTGEYVGASYLFGYVQNKYRDKAQVWGIPADLASGVVLKAVSLGCDIAGVATGLSSHVGTVGNAGLGAYFHTLGAGHGAHSAGVYRLLLTSEADKAKALQAFPKATILGDLPKATRGDFLSAAQLAEMAR